MVSHSGERRKKAFMAGVGSNESEVSPSEGTFESWRGSRYTRRERRRAVSRETENMGRSEPRPCVSKGLFESD